MAKSKWMVASKPSTAGRQYVCYRLTDRQKVDAEENREYRGLYTTDRSAAQALADYLNEQEAAI